MSMRTKKVITTARFRAVDSTQSLNLLAAEKAVVIGRRVDASDARVGLLGKVCESSQASNALDSGVWLDLSFPHVIGIFGSRGSGKSFDLGVIAEDVAAVGPVDGKSDQTRASIIFDVQDQFWTLGSAPNPTLDEDRSQLAKLDAWGMEARAVENVKLWAPQGYKTPLAGVQQLQISPQQLAVEDWLALLQLERFSSIGQALVTLVRAFPNDGPESLANRCIGAGSLAAFQTSTLEALRWRLESLSGIGLVGPSSLAIDKLLTPGAVSILLMRQLGDSLRALVVGVIARLVADRMGQHHQAKRVSRRLQLAAEPMQMPDRLWVFLDEAHVVVPAEGATAASLPIVDFVKRGRDSGLSLVFATQQPSAVDPRLMSQVDLTLTHFLGFETDLQAAIARMPTRTSVKYELGTSKDIGVGELLRSLDPGECIVADAASGRIFAAAVRPRVTAHGGNTPV